MMTRLERALLVGAAVFFGAALAWRWLSQRNMPCPPWLSGLLDNPYMNTVAGSRRVLDRMRLAPGMRVLDVGCGPGRLTVPAAQRVGAQGEVTAFDIQPEMLARARARVQAAGLNNVRFVQGGVGQGALEPNYYDRAMLITVLGETPDRRAAVADIFQALKPGGTLCITEVLPDPDYQSYRRVKRLVTETGFDLLDYEGNWVAYTANFVKPMEPLASKSLGETLTRNPPVGDAPPVG